MNARRLSLLGVAALVIGGCGSTDSGSSGSSSGTSTGTQSGATGSGTGSTGSTGGTGSGTGSTGNTGSGTGSTGTGSGSTGSSTGTAGTATGSSGSGTGTSGTTTGKSGTSGTSTGTTGTSGTATGTSGTATGTSGTATGTSGTAAGASGASGTSGTSVGDGGVSASGLPVPATTGVAKPSGAVGGLSVLNWAGFTAAASWNFDDANSSQVSNYAALEALGIHYTFFLWANKLGQSGSPVSAFTQAVKDGHEMGNHTYDHMVDDGTAASDTMTNDTDVSKADTTINSDLNVTAYTFAEPNGDHADQAPGAISHFIVRDAANGLMMPNTSETNNAWQQVHCFIPNPMAPATDFESQIDTAISGGGWRVILVHGFVGGTDGAYQPVNLSDYQTAVMYAKSKPNLWIDTMVNVGAYWRAQSILKAVTATTSGTMQTYTWTLPANFPKGKYLRVTVTGGTVSQNGQPLTWDTHGYYEIALDDGSLTIQ